MGLADPRINYKALKDVIIAFIAADTVTLNYNLPADVKQVIGGNPYITPIPNTMYPSVLVRLDSKSEEFVVMGGSRKQADVTFSVFGVVRKLSSSDSSEDEALQLADNVEAIFRDNININNNVQYAQSTLADFGLGDLEGTYVSLFQLQIVCRVRIK